MIPADQNKGLHGFAPPWPRNCWSKPCQKMSVTILSVIAVIAVIAATPQWSDLGLVYLLKPQLCSMHILSSQQVAYQPGGCLELQCIPSQVWWSITTPRTNYQPSRKKWIKTAQWYAMVWLSKQSFSKHVKLPYVGISCFQIKSSEFHRIE